MIGGVRGRKTVRPFAGNPVGRVRWRSRERGIARREIIAAAALGLSVLALAVPAVWVSKARMSAQSAAVPLLRAGASARPGGADAARARSGGDVSEEVRRLRDEVVRLQDERRRLEEELSRAVVFRKRAAAAELNLGRFVEAFIVGRSVNWQERSFLVDRGSGDGVTLRAGCLAGGAVVGVVVEVGPHVARVAMVSEPDVRVAVRTLHTRRSGLAVGTGAACELRYIPRWAGGSERPLDGEPLVTSGRLGFFPPGFLLGWITSIGEHGDSLHLSIAVRPEIDGPPDGRVWILKPTPREVE